jgi:hypothetical protein
MIRYFSDKRNFAEEYLEINNDNGIETVFARNGAGSLPDVII